MSEYKKLKRKCPICGSSGKGGGEHLAQGGNEC